MRIRQATLADLSKIMEIAQQFFLDIPDFNWHTEEVITGMIQMNRYFVAEHEREIIAILSLNVRPRDVDIKTIAVRKECQRSGVGKKLIRFAKKFAVRHKRITLSVGAFYEYNNLDFYKKAGFRRVRPGTFNGHKYHNMWMRI